MGHECQFKEVGVEISKDDAEIKEWAECQICGKAVYRFKPNKWHGEDLDRKCPECGKQLVRFSRFKKLNPKDRFQWNATSPNKLTFIGCQGHPECKHYEKEPADEKPAEATQRG